MNEKDEDVAHAASYQKCESPGIGPNSVIRQEQAWDHEDGRYLWLDSVAGTIGNTVLIPFEVSILFESVDEQFFEIHEWLLNKGEVIEVTREEDDMALK